ncbi:MAG: arylesterase [Kangiellaceae bacterium]
MKWTKLISVALLLSIPFFAQAADKTVLVFGDSLSAAYNLPTEKGWVTLLEQKFGQHGASVKFINGSISGETSSGGLVRFPNQLKQAEPDVVVLELGANDGLRGFDLATTRSNLTKMIELSHQAGAKVLLAGIHIPPNYGRTYTRKFDQIFQDLAAKDNVALIPFILQGVATVPGMMLDDGLHPSEKGQKVMVDTVFKYLEPMLK